MVDIVTTIVQTGTQFLSTVTVGGQSFLSTTINITMNLMAVYANAVLVGLHM